MINYDDLTPENLPEKIREFMEKSGLDSEEIAELMWRRHEYIDGILNGDIKVETADLEAFKYFFKFFKRADIAERITGLLEIYDLSTEDIATAKDIPEDVIDRIVSGETEPTDAAITELGDLLLRYDEAEFLELAKLAGIHILAKELADHEEDEIRQAKMRLVLAEMQESFREEYNLSPDAVSNPEEILDIRYWPISGADTLMIELAFCYPFFPHGLKLDKGNFQKALEKVSGLLDSEYEYYVNIESLLEIKKSAEKCHKKFSPWILVAGLASVALFGPFVPAVLGAAAGFYGAAAVAAGLATLGGGALAIGGAGMAGGLWILGGIGAASVVGASVISKMLTQLGFDGALVEILKLQTSFHLNILDAEAYAEAKQALSEMKDRIMEIEREIGYLIERNDSDSDQVKSAKKIRTALENAYEWMDIDAEVKFGNAW